MPDNEERPGKVWFFNAESFKIPPAGTVLPVVFYNGMRREVVGEATFREDGQIECVFSDSLRSEVVQSLALEDYPMSFSIDQAEIEDLRAPLWRGKPFSSIGEEERMSIDKILKIEIPPIKPQGEAE